jgi:hypothetical protein
MEMKGTMIGILFNPHPIGLTMGPNGKIVGGLVRFPIDVFKTTESERASTTLNSFYNRPDIASRVLLVAVEELDEASAVTFKENSREAAFHCKSHCMI